MDKEFRISEAIDSSRQAIDASESSTGSNDHGVLGKRLRENIETGDINGAAVMKKAKLSKAKVEKRKKQRKKRSKQKRTFKTFEEITGASQSKLLQCKACKGTNTVIQSIQSRAADEPTTDYLHCTDCNFIERYCG